MSVSYTYNHNEISDRVWVFIYGCAMHDAILQQAFTGDKDWIGKVEEPKKILRKYIDRVLTGEFVQNNEEAKNAHDKLFLSTANEICEKINSSPMKPTKSKSSNSKIGVFSFGNAQKLINMTVKHVYTFTYNDPNIRKCFRHCHCPMDSIMLKKVYDLYEKEYGRKKKLDELTVKFNDPWGNEGWNDKTETQPTLKDFPPRYKKFQNSILKFIEKNSGDIFPVEFDYRAWKI